jgi:hypothetical protein
MLRPTVLMNAAEALKYYWKEIERCRDIAQEVERAREKAAVELGQVKYYTREGAGIWYGKAVELAGLPREVTEEHLRLMLEGKTLDGERMGARLNTTREAIVWDTTEGCCSIQTPGSRQQKM